MMNSSGHPEERKKPQDWGVIWAPMGVVARTVVHHNGHSLLVRIREAGMSEGWMTAAGQTDSRMLVARGGHQLRVDALDVGDRCRSS